jgi:hypothetical protein
MSAQVEEVVASAQSLADMADSLEKAVSVFKVSVSETERASTVTAIEEQTASAEIADEVEVDEQAA